MRFLVVYIREAHPTDEWQVGDNEEQEVLFAQPIDIVGRQAVATECCIQLEITIPCVVDELDDRVDNLYAGWPERLFVVDGDGTVAYAGAQGPWGFDVGAVEEWLLDRFGD